MAGCPAKKSQNRYPESAVPHSPPEIERLQTAVRWLESHHRRLEIQKRSLESKLGELSREIDRVSRELDIAADRLQRLQYP